LRQGLCPGPRWGAYSAPSDPLAGFKGRGKGKKREKGRDGGEGEKKKDKKSGEEGKRKGVAPPPKNQRARSASATCDYFECVHSRRRV